MEMSMDGTTTRRRRCSHCGELKTEVLGRQRLCEDCEQDMTYCQVCDEWCDRTWGDGCRHVQWNDDIGYAGCGSTEVNADAHRESFMALATALRALSCSRYVPSRSEFESRPLLPAMRRLIASDNLWTCWCGPLIGGPPSLDLRYEKKFPKHTSVLTLRTIEPREQLAWGEQIEKMQLGMAWLTSLDSETTKANRLTARWISGILNTQ
jgi:hypothetical protein